MKPETSGDDREGLPARLLAAAGVLVLLALPLTATAVSEPGPVPAAMEGATCHPTARPCADAGAASARLAAEPRIGLCPS